VPPAHTRGYVGRALRMLQTKREAGPARKHGNIPL
jgi:propionyl-CoA carboxylase beta chain